MVKNHIMAIGTAGNIGFIGLGLMGKPMAVNLAAKLDEGQKLYVFDLVESAMDDLIKQHPTIVHKCSSIKEVADKSVCNATLGDPTCSVAYRPHRARVLTTANRTRS